MPGSKSQSIRALILATMARGESRLDNILVCDDTRDAQQVCRQLGAQLTVRGNQYTLASDGLPLAATAKKLNAGNSGITTRFVLPLLGLRQNCDQVIELDCSEQMRARPIRPLVDALRTLGMQIEYLGREGMLPLKISGTLRGGAVEVDGITSQYTSALLLSLPCAPEDSVITVRNLHERPYVLMTLKWLEDLGITFHHEQHAEIDVFKGSGPGEPLEGQPLAALSIVVSGAKGITAVGSFDGSSIDLQGVGMRIRIRLGEITEKDVSPSMDAMADFEINDIYLTTSEPLTTGEITFNLDTTLSEKPSGNQIVDGFLAGSHVVVEMKGLLDLP